MRAVTAQRQGGPDVLRWDTAELPAPGAGDLLIRVAAAGVNNADLLQRQGRYRVPEAASPILGLEVAGVIEWVGPAVEGWHIGDQVCALLQGGGYAEYALSPADLVLPIPTGSSFTEAASFPEAACTVYSNLSGIAGLHDGQSVLIHGGAGGMGSFAIQWAKAIGATVLTTVGSGWKAARCEGLGADRVIDYRTTDFAQQVLLATDGRGVDAVLDIVGADYLDRNVRALAADGHVIVIGAQGTGPDRPLNLGLLMAKRASVSATTLRARPHEQRAAIVAAVRRDVWPLIEAGAVSAVVDSTFSMSDAGAAHRRMESGDTVGKVILETGLGSLLATGATTAG